MYDYAKAKEPLSVKDATRFDDPNRPRMRGGQADYKGNRDAAGLLHEGPYKGKDHPVRANGATRPAEGREASFRSTTSFVPGMSFAPTDPIGIGAADSPAAKRVMSATQRASKALRKSVQPLSHAASMKAAIVKEGTPSVVVSRPKGPASATPDRTLSATASKMFNIGADTSAVVNPVTGRYVAPVGSSRPGSAIVSPPELSRQNSDLIRSPTGRVCSIATNIPCPPSHPDVIAYRHYNGGKSPFVATPDYKRPLTPANSDFIRPTSGAAYSAAQTDYQRNKFYGRNSFIFS